MKKLFVAIIVFVMPFACFAQVNLTEGLIGCYSFSGDATDRSIKQNHGTIHGAVLTSDRFGSTNSAYLFNGFNSFISISSAGLKNPKYSYSIWAKVSTNPGEGNSGILFSIGDEVNSKHQTVNVANVYASNELVGWNVGGYNNGTPGTTSLQSKVMPVVGQWYHLVGTRNGNEMKMYINGVLVTTGSTFGLQPYYGDNTTAHIGLRCNYTQPFDGVIDDFAIYDREITPSEVMKLYQDGLPCNDFYVEDVSRCGPGQVAIEAQGSDGYSWYNSAGDLLFEGNPFIVSVTESSLFKVTDHNNILKNVQVNIFDVPKVECVSPLFLLLNEPNELKVSISEGTPPFNVRWEEDKQILPNSSTTVVEIVPKTDKEYEIQVFVTDQNNCVNSCGKVLETAEIFIPNVVTPNSDQLNDVFNLYVRLGDQYFNYEGHESFMIRLFNRWGKLVYQTSNPLKGWIATDAAAGIYFYEVTLGANVWKGPLHVVN